MSGACQEAIEQLEARALQSGAYGLSTERHLEGRCPLLALPQGAQLHSVQVLYIG